jgi:hypothetical protein
MTQAQALPTANTLILFALKLAGVLGEGQIASAENVADSLVALNNMLAAWSKLRWLVYVLNTYTIQSTNQQTYTVGPGGDINIPVRPNRIDSCYFRQNLGESPYAVDYTLTCIEAREDYNGIRTKLLNSFPEYYFYESDWPLGTLYIWPIPPTIYQIFVSVMQPLGNYVNLTDSMNLPPEYAEVIIYNLAARLCAMFGKPLPPEVKGIAQAGLSMLRRANAQIPTEKMPQELLRRGIYNPYSDTMR